MARTEGTQVNEISRISKSTEFKGYLISESDIRIDGRVEGNIITTGKLVIGESAVVSNSIIICQSVDIWGKVEGSIWADEAVTLKSTSSLTGAMHTPKMSIDIGAIFNGTCKIINDQEFKRARAEYIPEKDSAHH